MRNRFMFEKMVTGMALAAAVMAGAAVMPGSGHGLVVRAYAADVSNQNALGMDTGVDKTDKAGGEEGTASNNDDSGVYAFADNKTSGAVTIIKKWDDGLKNEEREIPDMSISTEKPSKSTKGYTVTFHGNGLKFADGTDENMVVYNSSGQIVEGSYKEAVGTGVGWYSDEACKNRVMISNDGVPQVELTGDLDLWAKEMTFEIKGYNGSYQKKYNDFNYLIPDAVTEIIFTDEAKPKTKEAIDVDADRDGGVVAWLDDDAGTVMKVSTQVPSVKVQAAKDSRDMFYYRGKLQRIDLKMLDTQNVTNMSSMFYDCSGLTSLDLTSLDTQNVTDMSYMFSSCSGLTGLDLTPLNTQNVTYMSYMFSRCSGLTSLDLTPLDTHKVKYMGSMFLGCSGLTSLNLTSLNTQNVTRMDGMFYRCSNLVKLDLSSFDTSNVTTMGGSSKYDGNSFSSYGQSGMFENCSSLASLIIPFNTSHVTDFGMMFKGCDALTTLDISTFDTTAAKNMSSMFDGCKKLTNIDLSKVNTKNVTSLNGMFNDCNNLKSLDLSSFDTSNVTDMVYMFCNCSALTSLTTGTTFKFVGTSYRLSGTWQNTAGETFTTGTFPSNVADTYTKVSS